MQRIAPNRPTDKELLEKGGSDPKLLERFMKEFFPYGEFKKAGLFTKEMKGDYYWMAFRICHYLGLNIIYEYGKDEIRCHITYAEGKRPPNTPFIEITPSIYD